MAEPLTTLTNRVDRQNREQPNSSVAANGRDKERASRRSIFGTQARLQEVRLAYQIFEPQNKTSNIQTVLLFHPLSGGPNAQRWFNNAITYYTSHGFQVIVPNNLGSCHGSDGISSRALEGNANAGFNPESLFDMETTCRAVNNLLDELDNTIGIGKLHIVGGSLGGRVANKFISMYPQRCSSATIIASDIFPTEEQQKWSLNAIALAFINESFYRGQYIQKAFSQFNGDVEVAKRILVDPTSDETIQSFIDSDEALRFFIDFTSNNYSTNGPNPPENYQHNDGAIDDVTYLAQRKLNGVMLTAEKEASIKQAVADLGAMQHYIAPIQAVLNKTKRLLQEVRRMDNDMFESAEKIAVLGEAITTSTIEYVKGKFEIVEDDQAIAKVKSIFQKIRANKQLSESEQEVLDVAIGSIEEVLNNRGYLYPDILADTKYATKKLPSIRDDDWIELVDYLVQHLLFSGTDMSNVNLKKFPQNVLVVTCRDDLLVRKKQTDRFVDELRQAGKTVFTFEVDGSDIYKTVCEAAKTDPSLIDQIRAREDLAKVLLDKNGNLANPKHWSAGHDSFLVGATDAFIAHVNDLVINEPERLAKDYCSPANCSPANGVFVVDTAKTAEEFLPKLISSFFITSSITQSPSTPPSLSLA